MEEGTVSLHHRFTQRSPLVMYVHADVGRVVSALLAVILL